MIKISERDEAKFTLAATLHKGGRFSNTIYAKGDSIFIYNTDHTVLLRFQADKPFPEEVKFFAGDYSSSELEVVEDGIVFYNRGETSGNLIIESKELCRIPDTSFRDIQDLHDKYRPSGKFNRATLTKELLTFLKEGLSHVEFSSDGESFFMVQRDLYSGKIIRTESKERGMGLTKKEGWEFRGLRLVDLQSILSFGALKDVGIDFYFVDPFYTWIECSTWKMTGILTTCVYDELGNLGILGGENNGREEQKVRSGVRKIDTEVEKNAKAKEIEERGKDRISRRRVFKKRF